MPANVVPVAPADSIRMLAAGFLLEQGRRLVAEGFEECLLGWKARRAGAAPISSLSRFSSDLRTWRMGVEARRSPGVDEEAYRAALSGASMADLADATAALLQSPSVLPLLGLCVLDTTPSSLSPLERQLADALAEVIPVVWQCDEGKSRGAPGSLSSSGSDAAGRLGAPSPGVVVALACPPGGQEAPVAARHILDRLIGARGALACDDVVVGVPPGSGLGGEVAFYLRMAGVPVESMELDSGSGLVAGMVSLILDADQPWFPLWQSTISSPVEHARAATALSLLGLDTGASVAEWRRYLGGTSELLGADWQQYGLDRMAQLLDGVQALQEFPLQGWDDVATTFHKLAALLGVQHAADVQCGIELMERAATLGLESLPPRELLPEWLGQEARGLTRRRALGRLPAGTGGRKQAVLVGTLPAVAASPAPVLVMLGCGAGDFPDSWQETLERAAAGRDLVLLTASPNSMAAGRAPIPSRAVSHAYRSWTGAPFHWDSVIPSSTAGLLEGAALGLEEQRLRFLVSQELLPLPGEIAAALDLALEPAVRFARDRASPHVTSYDGKLATPDPRALLKRPISDSAVRDWARCPLSFFYKRVLQVKPMGKGDFGGLALSPLDRGNLLHLVLADVAALGDRTAEGEETQGGDALVHIVEGRLDRYARMHPLTPPAALLAERTFLLQAARAWITHVAGGVSETTVVLPASAIGVDADPALLGLEMDGEVKFQGRVDWWLPAEDGTPREIVDFKQSKPNSSPASLANVYGNGQLLQLPLYALLIAAHTSGNPSSTSLFYWFFPRDRMPTAVPVEFGVQGEEIARELLGGVVRGIGTGNFPMVPGKRGARTYDNCRTCEYDAVCPVNRAALYAAKQEDPSLDWHRRVRLES